MTIIYFDFNQSFLTYPSGLLTAFEPLVLLSYVEIRLQGECEFVVGPPGATGGRTRG